MEKRLEQDRLLAKEKKLISILQSYKKVLVAFSGGVDSTYLLAVANETLGINCKAVFARGSMISSDEQKEALALALHLNISLNVIDLDIFTVKEFRENPLDRCYFCKKKIFEVFLELSQDWNIKTIIEGTNATDSKDYRPGRIALQELGIQSPLQDVGLTKEEIRTLSERRKLPTWNKPSMACLASRVPYGNVITEELLHRIARAEKILYDRGLAACRVRVHGDLARIEIPLDAFTLLLDNRQEITTEMIALGFRFVTLDLMGIRSGSLNPIHQEA